MAGTLSETALFGNSTTPARSLQAVATLRLVLGLTALLGAIIFLEGTSWDIQWHTYIGRDRTLIPPHIMMLSGVALSGFSGLLIVLIESWWGRHKQSIAHYNARFAGIFAGPLGAYIVGYAALLAAVAFPLDAYWHTLYGIDVSIWAPFHVMFIVSMGVVALGSVYVLISAAHLAGRIGSHANRRVASWGVILALATCLSLFTLLLFDSLQGENTIDLGFMQISLFPLLTSILVAFVLITAAYALPWRWAATGVSVCYLFLAGIMAVFVQPATDWLLSVERLHYRESPPLTSSVALEWFITPVLVAILIDVVVRQAQRKQWSRRKQMLLLALAALLSGALPVVAIYPLLPLLLALDLGIASFLISLLLGLGGAYVGAFFGWNVGESISSLER